MRKRIAAWLGWGLALGVAGSPVMAETPVNFEKACVRGMRMLPGDAAALEKQLKTNPDDADARARLMGFYFKNSQTSERLPHVMWMIQHYPEEHFAGSPLAQVRADEAGYGEAKALWMKLVKERPEAGVLGNAAKFIQQEDPAGAEKLLEQAAEAAPKDPRWYAEMGEAEMRRLIRVKGTADERAEIGKKALKDFEEALTRTDDRLEKTYLYPDLAKAALVAGDEAAAKKYGEAMLAAAKEFPNDWNAGNAIYQGNTVLGQIALARGDVDAAKKYLIASAKTNGSPQLGSFGPNTTLAKGLLEKGEREVVLEYFDLCGKFWGMGDEKLKEWSAVVKAGGMPEWGGNLYY